MSRNTKAKSDSSIGDVPVNLDDHMFYGIRLDDEQRGFANAIWNKDNLIVMSNSPSGTGKTLIAVGVANLLVKHGLYDEIVYIMSPYAEHRQGFLPGTIYAKSEPYYKAMQQALITIGEMPSAVIHGEDPSDAKMSRAYITCMTDTFLRGNTISKSVVILDESQNFTTEQLRTTLSRVTDNDKVIVIGHTGQIDMVVPERSGFSNCINHYSPCEWCEVCEMHTNHRGKVSLMADAL